jgi:hypothetical protein
MKEPGTDIACIKLGNVHVIPITCPAIAREVLRKQDACFASRPLTFASETFSGGYRNAVLSPYGDQWRKMRRVLASEIVCPSRHKWLHEKRADEANNLTRYVYNLAMARREPLLRQRHPAPRLQQALLWPATARRRPRPAGGGSGSLISQLLHILTYKSKFLLNKKRFAAFLRMRKKKDTQKQI